VGVIVPLGRPERLEHVLALWRAQTVRVPLVVAGKQAGPWVQRALDAGAGVVTNCLTIGDARNAGMLELDRFGEEWAIQWDDDNHYGPGNVEDFMRHTRDADVLTRGIGFVRWGAELFWFDRFPSYFPGHSTAVRLSIAPRFPRVSLGEELQWSRELELRGARVKRLGPWHMVYDRTRADHACRLGRIEMLEAYGGALPLGEQSDKFVETPRELELELERVVATEAQVFGVLERRAAEARP
jgi:hypothetical protein